MLSGPIALFDRSFDSSHLTWLGVMNGLGAGGAVLVITLAYCIGSSLASPHHLHNLLWRVMASTKSIQSL